MTMAPSLYPLMRFSDAPAALDFLERAFGFTRREVVANPDGTILHAELALGPSILMIGSDRDDPRLGRRAGKGWIYVAVDDADEHCRTARREGAQIVAEPFDTDYGSRDYTALDPEGNQWHFGTYRPVVDVGRAELMASESASPVFRRAGISYLRIPAQNPQETAAFYEHLFGWTIDTDRPDPSFEDGTGHVIGHFIPDGAVAGEAGVRPYIYVDSVDDTLAQVTSHDGVVVEAPYPEGDLWVATFRDPAGNVFGVWQRGPRD